MIKRSSKISSVLRCGLLIFLLSIAIPGCKKEAPPPAAAPVKPLPAKTAPAAPGAVTATTPVKPLQAAPSSARKAAAPTPASAQKAVQNQISTAKLPTAAAAVNLDFTSKRDPFKPFVQTPPKQSAGAKSRTRDPLPIQKFDTEKFRVSGIITGIKENSALVIDPGGKGHIVKEGMPFGANDGRVKRVTNTTVEVEESFSDDFGKVRKRLVKLTLLRKK
ncbi:MAG: pilus assembly protein PilP [Deltaproteobacteria bacterium HGW-Deltaproteobacteria-23]|nr:MAG: pilus assembly protein PilP [Deltaproteobacteria bacterium HGW-Deltaproteobacteria-23]